MSDALLRSLVRSLVGFGVCGFAFATGGCVLDSTFASTTGAGGGTTTSGTGGLASVGGGSSVGGGFVTTTTTSSTGAGGMGGSGPSCGHHGVELGADGRNDDVMTAQEVPGSLYAMDAFAVGATIRISPTANAPMQIAGRPNLFGTYVSGDGRAHMTAVLEDGSTCDAGSAAPVAKDVPTQIVGTFSQAESKARIFIDGLESGATDCSTGKALASIVNPERFIVGNGSNGAFLGKITDVFYVTTPPARAFAAPLIPSCSQGDVWWKLECWDTALQLTPNECAPQLVLARGKTSAAESSDPALL